MAIVIHPSQIYEINYTKNTVPLRGVQYAKLEGAENEVYTFSTSIGTNPYDKDGNPIDNPAELSDEEYREGLLVKNNEANQNSIRTIPDSIEVETFKTIVEEEGGYEFPYRYRWLTFKYTIDFGEYSRVKSIMANAVTMPFQTNVLHLAVSSVTNSGALENGDNIFYDAVGSDFPKYNFGDEGETVENIFGNVAFSVDDNGVCTIYVKTYIVSEKYYQNVVYGLIISFGCVKKQQTTIEGGRGEEYFDLSEVESTASQEALATEIMADRRLPKPTVKLLCGLDEYYDENGNLVVSHEDSTKPMLISVGSIVIPYKQTVMGEAPIARDIGYAPKKFYVYNSRFVLQGAPFQELSLVGI